MSMLKTFMANLRRAKWDGESIHLGGGTFSPAEIQQVLEDIGRKKPQRMWINQPSTLQPLHDMHGTNVLAVWDYEGRSEDYYSAYLLSGDMVSMTVSSLCLSPGWLTKEKES